MGTLDVFARKTKRKIKTYHHGKSSEGEKVDPLEGQEH